MKDSIRRLKLDLIRYKVNGKIKWSEISLWVVFLYRLGQYFRSISFKPLRIILLFVWSIFNFPFILLTGIHIPRGADIKGGLRIYHFGGIIINSKAIIGENCTLRHGVTIGNKNFEHDVPIIGNNVDIGCGATIIGKIKIGDNVKVGANVVITKDIMSNSVVVGAGNRIISL